MCDVNRKQNQNRNQRKHSFHRTLQKWYKKIRNIRLQYLRKSEGLLTESEPVEEPVENPWIDAAREIVEQILKQKIQKMTAMSEKMPENTGLVTEQNLDIEVPIGYNVVIVKVDKTL